MTSITLSPAQECAVDEYLSAARPNWTKFAAFCYSTTDYQKVLTRITTGYYVDEYDPMDGGYRKQAIVRGRPVLLEFEGISTDGEGPLAFMHYTAKNEDAWIAIYNVASRSSFEVVVKVCEKLIDPNPWNETLQPLTRRPMFVFATDANMSEAQWEVPLQEGEQFALKVGAKLMKVSPRTGEGLDAEGIEKMVLHVLVDQHDREKARQDEAAAQMVQERKPGRRKKRWLIEMVSEKIKKMLKGVAR